MSVTLPSGEEVRVNDHVYYASPWAIRDATPYSIARIMEFLQPEDSLTGKNMKYSYYDRVRLAWYYRPADVTDRPVADSRLLLSAIYSEIVDINHLRAKCYVMHRDKISDLAGWKKRPDRFYFTRLFDPYIKREFEVISSNDVRNIPDNVREALISRYEYVVAEKEVVPDLTDSIRLCDTCEQWCPNPETVQCDRCKKFFHMRCVQPPLLAKPSRGYGWTCAPCSKQHEEEVDSHDVRHPTLATMRPRSNAPPPRGRGRPRKDKCQAEKEENLPIRHYKMWPFRYFGQYTVAEDTLDPEDTIFPRTVTRVGAKFQVNVSSAPEGCPAPEVEERGGDQTVDILSIVNEMVPAEVTEMEAHMKTLTDDEELQHNVDWLTEVIRRYSDALTSNRPLVSVNMKSPLRVDKWKGYEVRYSDRPWTRDEIVAFEDALLTNGAELRLVRDEVGTRSMPEVVRFYGHWKNSRLGEENARLRRHGSAVTRDTIVSWPKVEGGRLRVGLADDESSIVKESGRSIGSCGACRTKESKIWWKAPKGLPTNILCESCGMAWRKYADLNVRPSREEALPSAKGKGVDRQENSPGSNHHNKRSRASTSSHSTPPPNQHVPQVQCRACLKHGPVGKVLKCKRCQFRVHAASCGVVVDPSAVDSWLCDICKNETTLEASLIPDCLLCPRLRWVGKGKSITSPPDSYLRACKPTEGQGWAHVLCSVFLPELTFTDANTLQKVEGISVLPQHRWTTPCSLCEYDGGAVIRCNDCPKEFHVSCAWKFGHKFGFEIQPVKVSRRDLTTVVTFKDELGSMSPVVSCKEHNTRRDVYEICDMNEAGETALQVYCKYYKQAQTRQAHDLLRKARRLDQILNVRDASTPQPQDNAGSEPRCQQCQTVYSPFFHRYPESTEKISGSQETVQLWLCHRCYFEKQQGLKTSAVLVS